jgi:hypothetical protein
MEVPRRELLSTHSPREMRIHTLSHPSRSHHTAVLQCSVSRICRDENPAPSKMVLARMMVGSTAGQVRARRYEICSLKGSLCITCNNGTGLGFSFNFACMESRGLFTMGARKHIRISSAAFKRLVKCIVEYWVSGRNDFRHMHRSWSQKTKYHICIYQIPRAI